MIFTSSSCEFRREISTLHGGFIPAQPMIGGEPIIWYYSDRVNWSSSQPTLTTNFWQCPRFPTEFVITHHMIISKVVTWPVVVIHETVLVVEHETKKRTGDQVRRLFTFHLVSRSSNKNSSMDRDQRQYGSRPKHGRLVLWVLWLTDWLLKEERFCIFLFGSLVIMMMKLTVAAATEYSIRGPCVRRITESELWWSPCPPRRAACE